MMDTFGRFYRKIFLNMFLLMILPHMSLSSGLLKIDADNIDKSLLKISKLFEDFLIEEYVPLKCLKAYNEQNNEEANKLKYNILTGGSEFMNAFNENENEFREELDELDKFMIDNETYVTEMVESGVLSEDIKWLIEIIKDIINVNRIYSYNEGSRENLSAGPDNNNTNCEEKIGTFKKNSTNLLKNNSTCQWLPVMDCNHP